LCVKRTRSFAHLPAVFPSDSAGGLGGCAPQLPGPQLLALAPAARSSSRSR
jgi:hypothetical protein